MDQHNIRKDAMLVKPEKAAEILGVSPDTLAIWRSVKRYPLPYVKIGKNVMYKIEDVQSFIDSRTIYPSEV